MDFSFVNNWRRTLILTNFTDKNVDKPIPYIVLDDKKLPCSFNKFCSQFFYEYGFDYDLNGKVLWPSNDSDDIEVLADNINKSFPKTASIVYKKPIVVHNLDFNTI